MTWWLNSSTILLLVCPVVALLTGLSAGFFSRNWGLGILTGATIIVIPLLLLEIELQFFFYTPVYALIGLLGSILGYGLAKLILSTRSTWTEEQPGTPYERISAP